MFSGPLSDTKSCSSKIIFIFSLLSCVWSLHILCVDLSTDEKFLNIFCHSLKTVNMWESNSLRYRSSCSTLFVRGALVYCCICQAVWTPVSPGVLCYSLVLSIEWWDNRHTILSLALLMFWDLNYGPDADEHPQPLLPFSGFSLHSTVSLTGWKSFNSEIFFVFSFFVCTLRVNLSDKASLTKAAFEGPDCVHL